jgi:hypothetical protein
LLHSPYQLSGWRRKKHPEGHKPPAPALLQIVSSLPRTKVHFISRNLRALDLTIFTRKGYKCLAISFLTFRELVKVFRIQKPLSRSKPPKTTLFLTPNSPLTVLLLES